MEKLKELRIKNKMNQTQIAQFLDIPRTTYRNYESGRSEMGYDLLCKTADYYGITVDELLGRTSSDIFDNARIEQPEILQLYERMTPEEQSNIVNYARGIISGREIRASYESRKNRLA
mgnify:CR=1 FL=1